MMLWPVNDGPRANDALVRGQGCWFYTASLRWQAERWPGAISRSAGASDLQRAKANGQRG